MAYAAGVDDFNSSDIEVEERSDKYAHLGQDTLTKALERASEDRRESKIAYKQRPLYAGSPKTQQAQALWNNRFRSFLTSTLNVPANVMPTSEHLIRFIYAYPKYIQARSPSGVISYTTLSNGVSWILQTTQSIHPDFRLKAGEATRIKAVFSELLQQDVITKDASRASRWLGSRLIFLMTTTWIQNASVNGCMDWDFVLQGALAMSLLVSTAGRSGDIARTGSFKGVEYAKYGDFKVKVVTDKTGIEVLECLVELKYTKGKKDSANVALAIDLKLMSDQFNSCDPIKLLLIMALRTGNVEETSIEALLDITRRRTSRTVVWKDPTLPILKAARSNHSLILDSPAPELQARTILQRAAALVGVLAIPGTHDIRRGVAWETHNLPSDTGTRGEGRARRILGHSNKTKTSNLTSGYIGGAVPSLHQERLQMDWTETNMVNTHEQASHAYIQPSFSIVEVDNYLMAKNLPKRDQNERRKARRHMAKAHREEWSKANDLSQIEALDPDYESHTHAPVDPSLTTGISTKRKRLPELEPDGDNSSPVPTAKGKKKRVRDRESQRDEGEMPIDPKLQDFLSHIDNRTILDMDVEQYFDLEPVSADTLHSADHDQLEDSSESTSTITVAHEALALPCLEFIDYFSRINIQTDQVVASDGGSKDASSRFKFTCIKGCGYVTMSSNVIRAHETKCNGKSRYTLDTSTQLPCPRGCGKIMRTQRSVNDHVREIHDWVPKPCHHKLLCDQSILYYSRSSREKHTREAHPTFRARTCSLCPGEDKVWKSKATLESHLIHRHRLGKAEYKDMLT